MSQVRAGVMTRRNSPGQVLLASLVGTTIEFFDFYIFATAAVLVFPALFFPTSDPLNARLAALAAFGIAFVARPIGSALFGHFGDRIGRKTTLVASLLLMGGSTLAIAFLPTYATAGWIAPALLCLMRFGQGLGLGGEWGGAVVMSLEHGDPERRGLSASWPQVGVPAGNLLASGVLWVLSAALPESSFLDWGWRVPFLLSGLLVLVGLWIRVAVTESPAFAQLAAQGEKAKLPLIR